MNMKTHKSLKDEINLWRFTAQFLANATAASEGALAMGLNDIGCHSIPWPKRRGPAGSDQMGPKVDLILDHFSAARPRPTTERWCICNAPTVTKHTYVKSPTNSCRNMNMKTHKSLKDEINLWRFTAQFLANATAASEGALAMGLNDIGCHSIPWPRLLCPPA